MADEEAIGKPSRALHLAGVFLALLGLATSLAVALSHPPPPPPPDDPVPETLVNKSGIADPDGAFARRQMAIDAAETPAQKIQAGLSMVDFLMEADGWREEMVRWNMAREYVLALAEMDPIGRQRPMVAETVFRLAIPLADRELLGAGEKMLRGEPPMEEIPFDLLCAEADALLAVGEPAVAYSRIDDLGNRPESATSPWEYLSRMARSLRYALENERWMDALLAHRGLGASESIRKSLLTELAERSSDLTICGNSALEAEGWWNQAYVASERGQAPEAIEMLQQAIGKGRTPFRARAQMRLNELYRDGDMDMDQAILIGRMVANPELRAYALGELRARMEKPAAEKVAQELLTALDYYLDMPAAMEQLNARLLLAAAIASIGQGWLERAEDYLDLAEATSMDRELLADAMMHRAVIAEARGDRVEMAKCMVEVISLYPGHPREGDIRFRLLEEMASQPRSEPDLVGGIIGAITRLPRDPRGIDGLLMVANRLEAVRLYSLAETYYRHAILLSSLQQASNAEEITAEALLGQARVMIAQGNSAEADALLRVLNTNVRWAEHWNQSGPLWASLAFEQAQFREGVRRWRHTCGPPGGALLPHLFELLVPDVERGMRVDVAVPRKPAQVPIALVRSAADASVARLLEDADYVALDNLLAMMEADKEYGGQLPVETYRAQYFEQYAATQTLDDTFEWLRRRPIELSDPAAADLNAWMGEVESIRERVRSMDP
jgi:tetratricopeptide (TPR) repeat protein